MPAANSGGGVATGGAASGGAGAAQVAPPARRQAAPAQVKRAVAALRRKATDGYHHLLNRYQECNGKVLSLLSMLHKMLDELLGVPSKILDRVLARARKAQAQAPVPAQTGAALPGAQELQRSHVVRPALARSAVRGHYRGHTISARPGAMYPADDGRAGAGREQHGRRRVTGPAADWRAGSEQHGRPPARGAAQRHPGGRGRKPITAAPHVAAPSRRGVSSGMGL